MPVTISSETATGTKKLTCHMVWEPIKKRYVCSTGSVEAPPEDPIQPGGGTGGGDLWPDPDAALKALFDGAYRGLSSDALTRFAAPYTENARSIRRTVAALARHPRDTVGMGDVRGVFSAGNHVIAIDVEPGSAKPRAPRTEAERAAVAETLAAMATSYEAVGAAFKQAAWHATKLGSLKR